MFRLVDKGILHHCDDGRLWTHESKCTTRQDIRVRTVCEFVVDDIGHDSVCFWMLDSSADEFWYRLVIDEHLQDVSQIHLKDVCCIVTIQYHHQSSDKLCLDQS